MIRVSHMMIWLQKTAFSLKSGLVLKSRDCSFVTMPKMAKYTEKWLLTTLMITSIAETLLLTRLDQEMEIICPQSSQSFAQLTLGFVPFNLCYSTFRPLSHLEGNLEFWRCVSVFMMVRTPLLLLVLALLGEHCIEIFLPDLLGEQNYLDENEAKIEY